MKACPRCGGQELRPVWLPIMWCVHCRRNLEPRDVVPGAPFRTMPMIDPAPPAVAKPMPIPPAPPPAEEKESPLMAVLPVAKVVPIISLALAAALRLLAPTCRRCELKTEYMETVTTDFGNQVRIYFHCHGETFPVEVQHAHLMKAARRMHTDGDVLREIIPAEVA